MHFYTVPRLAGKSSAMDSTHKVGKLISCNILKGKCCKPL